MPLRRVTLLRRSPPPLPRSSKWQTFQPTATWGRACRPPAARDRSGPRPLTRHIDSGPAGWTENPRGAPRQSSSGGGARRRVKLGAVPPPGPARPWAPCPPHHLALPLPVPPHRSFHVPLAQRRPHLPSHGHLPGNGRSTRRHGRSPGTYVFRPGTLRVQISYGATNRVEGY